MSNLSEKNGRTPLSCKIHFPPSMTAISSCVIKKKIRDKENQAKREEEQSNFGAEENTVWDRLEVQNEELVAAVQQLKPKARFIVTGYVLKGKTFKELAQETKLTERAAASTYYRSIEKLRIKMEKEK